MGAGDELRKLSPISRRKQLSFRNNKLFLDVFDTTRAVCCVLFFLEISFINGAYI